MNYERITEDKIFDGDIRRVHEGRYMWANRFIKDTDTVLDAGCGIGYAKDILRGKYIGVDNKPVGDCLMVDLTKDDIDFDYDVFVGLEIIEHLPDSNNFVRLAKKAKSKIIVSAPNMPTKHFNPYHLQDFTNKSLRDLFVDDQWKVIDMNIGVNYVIYCFERV